LILIKFCVVDYQNEDSVGDAIRESGFERSDLYITTKYAPLLGNDVAAALQKSLTRVR
jgi:diketogulonate reductase-like aldo/keto reductase